MTMTNTMGHKILLLALLLFCSSLCFAKKNRYGPWSYKPGKYGPRNWGRIKGGSSCLGSNQSPIDINTAETMELEFPPFRFQGYNSDGLSGNARPRRMSNNGKTVKITLEGDYLVTGGGLPSTYRAAQIHFHWGADWTKGSEHTLNGQSFPAELHIVHYDTIRYQNIAAALRQSDGLAVLGFFLKVGRQNHAWDTIVHHLSNVRYVGNKFDYTQQPFRLDSLLPMRKLNRYYRYRGSLTTPGCYESVIWTVFDTPIELSDVQIDRFRTLTKLPAPPSQVRERFGGGADREEDLILDNFRPVQHLNYRQVYQSFEHEELEYDSEEPEESTDGWSIGFGFGNVGGTGTGTGTGTGIGVGAGTGTGGFNPNYGGGAGGAGGAGGYSDHYLDHINVNTGGAGGLGAGVSGGFSNYNYGGGVDGNAGVVWGIGTAETTGGTVADSRQTDYYGQQGQANTAQNQNLPGGQAGGNHGNAGTGHFGVGGAGGTGGGTVGFGGEYNIDYYNGGGYADAYGGGAGGGYDAYAYGGGGVGVGGAYDADVYTYGGGGNGAGGAYDPINPNDPVYQDPHLPGPETGVFGKTGTSMGRYGTVSDPNMGNSPPFAGEKTGVQEKGTVQDPYNPFNDRHSLVGTGGHVGDPYRAESTDLAGLAGLWQQLLNSQHASPDDAAYYHGDFGAGVEDMTTTDETNNQYYGNAMYNGFDNYFG